VSNIVRVIRAQVGETMEIQWRNLLGEVLPQRHTAPPPDTWKARIQQKDEVRTMGQAFDREGHVLGEAYGETKREVFDKLNDQFKDAHAIHIEHKEDPTPASSVTTEDQDSRPVTTTEDPTPTSSVTTET